MNEWEKKRSVKKLKQLIASTNLNLEGLTIYTEAATGYYSIAAALATMAGAKAVHCVAKSNRYGPASEAVAQTAALLNYVPSKGRTQVTFSEGHDLVKASQADIITNSNPLRPLNAALINSLRNDAVISLMYEPWEYRDGDIDVKAAGKKGIWIVGANEMHPTVKCFYSSGVLLLKGMLQAGLEVHSNHVILVCTNQFIHYILPMLSACCEQVDIIDNGMAGEGLPANVTRIEKNRKNEKQYDALLLMDSSQTGKWNVTRAAESIYPVDILGAWDACVQAMGDIKRTDFEGVKFIPEVAPPMGYMGFNPGSLGPELVVRTFIAGLKAGEEAIRFMKAGNSVANATENNFEWIKMFNPNHHE